MITTFLLYSGSMVFGIVIWVLNLVSLSVPVQIRQSFEWAFSYVKYFNNIVPIETLLQAVMFYLTVFTAVYSLRLVVKIIKLIPFIGDKDIEFFGLTRNTTTTINTTIKK